MRSDDLDPIKERLDKAHTGWGPWVAQEDYWDGYQVIVDDGLPGVSIIAEQIGQGEDEGRANAEFISHAPEDMKLLLDILEDYSDFVAELVEENHTLKYQLEQIKVAISNHPNPCSKHPEDDPVSCGWKSAYIDIVETLAC